MIKIIYFKDIYNIPNNFFFCTETKVLGIFFPIDPSLVPFPPHNITAVRNLFFKLIIF